LYSKVLHKMKGSQKHRMTFRLRSDLAEVLRQLPNQTAFVEGALREALERLCPLCHGTGQVADVHLAVSDLKGLHIRRLDRSTAAELRAVVRLGRLLLATQLDLETSEEDRELGFRLAREDQLLLRGSIPLGQRGKTEIRVAH
jgi:hypothetical protein